MRVTHRLLLVLVGITTVIAAGGIAALWPGQPEPPAGQQVQRTELLDATLVAVEEVTGVAQTGLNPNETTVAVTARIDASGRQVTFETTDPTGDTYATGQPVRLARIRQENQDDAYYIADFRRSRPLAVLAALFVTAVIGFGRWQGLRALAGLVVTFLLILGFIIPAILDGRSPLLVAVVGSLAIMTTTLYLSHGLHRKTTAAVVGTTLALLLTGLLAVGFVSAASITGFASEEARLANVEVGGLSLRGLILAGIIIGGLGVLDDVTMSQASTVFELHRADRRAGFGRLLRGALAVGRDHIAATVNTLFLAYAGASLPLLILFSLGTDPLGTVVTSETVAVEVVRTLVGSLGLIAAVPLTTALAAGLAVAEPEATAREARPGHAGGDAVSTQPTADEEDDEEWVARLRQAYRLPPGQGHRPPGEHGTTQE